MLIRFKSEICIGGVCKNNLLTKCRRMRQTNRIGSGWSGSRKTEN